MHAAWRGVLVPSSPRVAGVCDPCAFRKHWTTPMAPKPAACCRISTSVDSSSQTSGSFVSSWATSCMQELRLVMKWIDCICAIIAIIITCVFETPPRTCSAFTCRKYLLPFIAKYVSYQSFSRAMQTLSATSCSASRAPRDAWDLCKCWRKSAKQGLLSKWTGSLGFQTIPGPTKHSIDPNGSKWHKSPNCIISGNFWEVDVFSLLLTRLKI